MVTQFNIDLRNLFIELKNNDLGICFQKINRFINTYDKHHQFIETERVIKTTGEIKLVKHAFAESFEKVNVNHYLAPMTKNQGFHSGKLVQVMLNNALIVKAYILENINELNKDTYIIEALKLYNRIDHRTNGVNIDQFIEMVKYAYKNHSLDIISGLKKFTNLNYKKVEKYRIQKSDLENFDFDKYPSIEEAYKMWYTTVYRNLTNKYDKVQKCGFATFRKLLKDFGFLKRDRQARIEELKRRIDLEQQRINKERNERLQQKASLKQHILNVVGNNVSVNVFDEKSKEKEELKIEANYDKILDEEEDWMMKAYIKKHYKK